MPDPTDPDTEDRRPDHERVPDDEDDLLEEQVVDRQLDLFADEYDLVELALDDLRDMEGPDA